LKIEILLLNHLILLTKLFIYNHKKEKLTFNKLKAIFIETKKLEYQISKNTNTLLQKFYKKWEKIEIN
jgi:hypothetical protein